ncbi:HK97 family phage prohead protease [Rhizobium sp. Root482]|uniref:HK97 family phage prohead protease n=1 Tax=Rhizobium sp. Root482 TaxID=1736543 RepID=UPI001AEBB80D|nr:HK97 family phage prohead protease [Rhizobium sp. Root482]
MGWSRGQSRQPSIPKAKFFTASGREIKRPAIQGWACLYGQAFFASGRYRVMKAGAFIDTIYDCQSKRMLFDHNDSDVVGGTSSGLEFANSLDGLAFRMPLDRNARAAEIVDAVKSNSRACVSVGVELVENIVRKTTDGVEFDYCLKAKLTEISLVPEGAISGTYSAIVDLDDENPNLWLACRANAFATAKAVANTTARGQRIVDMLARLKA